MIGMIDSRCSDEFKAYISKGQDVQKEFPFDWRIKNQLDAPCYFIVLLIDSTCFGHYYAHHQELATVMLFTTLVVSFLVCCTIYWGLGVIRLECPGCRHTLRICNTYCLSAATVVARTRLCITCIRSLRILSALITVSARPLAVFARVPRFSATLGLGSVGRCVGHSWSQLCMDALFYIFLTPCFKL